ncbi:MAG: D-aminoacylase [Oscillospiraceae bacterium]|nr:D-aminoacylase [Oscillospiraceae bacterium]
MIDVLIKNGTVIDGTGAEAEKADIAIKDGRIVRIAANITDDSLRVIDAGGQYVSPGFVDSHCHTDTYAAFVPDAEAKLMQGVTTDVCGLCGECQAPVGAGHLKEYRERMPYQIKGAPELMPRTFQDYMDQINRQGNTTNMAAFVGNSALRIAAAGYEDRRLTAKEMDVMKGMLKESMEAGAFGLSTGLTYVPSCFADTEELIELSRAMAPYGGIYNSHMRNESDQILDSIREVIEIAEKSGCRGHVSHLKVTGKKNHGRAEECLELIHRANERGVPVTFDVYPYTAGSCSFKTLLPPAMLEKGVENFSDITSRKELLKELKEGLRRSDWDNMYLNYGADAIRVSAACGLEEYEGHTLSEIAEKKGISHEEAILLVLQETRGQASMIYEAACETDLKIFMKDPLCMLGTDAFARKYTGFTAEGKPHPRNYGAFPRYLEHYILMEKLLPVEEAVRKMTALPAEVFGLGNRGILREGAAAEITVWDPAAIRETGSYMEPWKQPQGISCVLMGGELAVDDGVFCDIRRGRMLKKEQ